VPDNVASYVLGALPEFWRTEFERHLEECQYPHEVAALGEVVEFLSRLAPDREPPVSLRSRILAPADADIRGRSFGA
jgi:anti-sigma factor RsiW